MFSKFVNFVPIDLKIRIYIDWTYTMYIAKNAFHGNQIPHYKA